ncbi:nucleoside deaminase [Zavarzinia sp. CC-PAN008]|uniref:nucleoside deaminase n=1 Tax=Zavarzinia sp. CC-PAN008 TaxID=3243332 RepID=UPI003F747878
MTQPFYSSSFMDRALALAEQAAGEGEVPVGAVVVDPVSRAIVAEGRNAMIRTGDPSAHAEMVAIRAASAATGRLRLDGLDLYVTLEPCTMCAGAISLARLRRVYYGAADVKGGAVDHGVRFFASPTCHHAPEVYGGIGERRAAEMLRRFFQARRTGHLE